MSVNFLFFLFLALQLFLKHLLTVTVLSPSYLYSMLTGETVVVERDFLFFREKGRSFLDITVYHSVNFYSANTVMDIDTEAKVYTITQPTDGPQAGKSSSNAGRRALKNIKGFGSKALAASLGFWMIVLIIAIIGVIPLTELIVGSVHKNACPMNHRIPIYLIVSGAVGLTIVIGSILQVSFFSIIKLSFTGDAVSYK
jgi:hypothetical protein